MKSWIPFLTVTIACGGGGAATDSSSLPTAGTTVGSTTAPACVALKEGPWSMGGSCFGMAMAGTVSLKPDPCKFTFSDWNMNMSVPEGGEVSDQDITLTGTGWDDCAGTATPQGRGIEGVCGDGCSFEMTFDG